MEAIFAAALLRVDAVVERAVTEHRLDRRSVLQLSKKLLTAQQEQLEEGAEVTAPASFLYLPTSGKRLLYGSVGDGNDKPHGLGFGLEYGRRDGFAPGPERAPNSCG